MTTGPEVPFFDLRAAFRRDREVLEQATLRVLHSGVWIGGGEVEAFEAAWATWAGAPFAVGVANGTDAITLALWAAGVGPGDEVLLPALSAYPTTVGVVRSGATPVFVDVKESDGLLNMGLLESAISSRTKAVLPVHLYGNPCDMPALIDIAERHHLAIVEDCAQAHGVLSVGRPVGSWSTAAAWSFYPTKNLGAAGDAGGVTTANAAVAARLKSLRNYGQKDRYLHEEAGINSRLDPIQAAILAARLPLLELRNAKRRDVGDIYSAVLAGQQLLRPVVPNCADRSNRHLYPVFVPEAGLREPVRSFLEARGVETLVHYPVAMPDQRATPRSQRQGSYPVARKLANTELSLPIYPELEPQQIERVVEALKETIGRFA